jgi:predicted amidohydrolase
MSADKFTLALAQIGPRLGDLDANREIITKSVADARAKGADLVMFPELSLTGYFLKDQVPTVAVRGDSRDLKWLRDLSRRIAIIVGVVEESPEFLFHNSALFFDGGELRHVHRKCYLPTYGLFDEQRYFARGHQIRAFDSRFGRSAILICEDMWHPSTVYIATADGALNLLCISSSPIWGLGTAELPENAQYWEQLMRFHAATWGINVAYCNRVGFEDGVGFWGGSQLFDPFADSVCKAPYFDQALAVGEISLNKIKRKRMSSTMLRDEDLDLTINELARIRSRSMPCEQQVPLAVKPRLARSKRASKGRS